VLGENDHFGHRENDGIVVDLFWDRGNIEGEFRVEVLDWRQGSRFVLHPVTGREAVQAFYHPFASAGAALKPTRSATPARRSWRSGSRTSERR
jgi:hypothetical protein